MNTDDTEHRNYEDLKKKTCLIDTCRFKMYVSINGQVEKHWSACATLRVKIVPRASRLFSQSVANCTRLLKTETHANSKLLVTFATRVLWGRRRALTQFKYVARGSSWTAEVLCCMRTVQQPNVLFWWVVFLLFVNEFPVSNLGAYWRFIMCLDTGEPVKWYYDGRRVMWVWEVRLYCWNRSCLIPDLHSCEGSNEFNLWKIKVVKDRCNDIERQNILEKFFRENLINTT